MSEIFLRIQNTFFFCGFDSITRSKMRTSNFMWRVTSLLHHLWKVPRNGAQAYSSGRYVSIPIYDDRGKLVENIEFENPNSVHQNRFSMSSTQHASSLRFEHGRRHAYLLRLPITDRLSIFRDVLKLGSENSAQAKATLDQKVKKLESLYILPRLRPSSASRVQVKQVRRSLHRSRQCPRCHRKAF